MILPFVGAVNAFMAIFLNLPGPILAFFEVAVIFAAITVVVKLVIPH